MLRVILDTSVLWDRDVLAKARPAGWETILPAIAFTERARQVQEAGREAAELWTLLKSNEIIVEDFRVEHGMRIAARLDKATWDRHARDALIAGHVGPDDVLWTKNPKDFLKVGLTKEQIVGF